MQEVKADKKKGPGHMGVHMRRYHFAIANTAERCGEPFKNHKQK